MHSGGNSGSVRACDGDGGAEKWAPRCATSIGGGHRGSSFVPLSKESSLSFA